jgi:hypothetical protein
MRLQGHEEFEMPGKTQALYPAARDVARLVAGREPDQALVAHYEIWAATLAAQRIISERVLKRSEARAAFAYVARAAGRLAAPLSTWTISDLLKDPTLGAFPELDDLRRLLDRLLIRAIAAKTSPMLVKDDGTTRSGRSRVNHPGAIKPKTMAAGMILLGFQEVRGRLPGPRNPDALEAADCLWRLSTREFPDIVRLEEGPRRGEDPTSGWRRHFVEALAENPILEGFHDDFVGQLRAGLAKEA